MVNENKTANYLKYAIGEIVLVVIGILIALQINNWNENRKLRIEEIGMLKDIKEDLKASINEIDRNISFNTNTIKNNRKILEYLNEDLPYDATLDTAFGQITNWDSPYFTFSAYETLKNKGLELIQNDSLKKAIINMYEFEFAFLEKDYDRSEWVLAQSVTFPITNKYVRRDMNSSFTGKPNDYMHLKTNDEFINMLCNIVRFREGGIAKFHEVRSKLETLIDDINKELNSR